MIKDTTMRTIDTAKAERELLEPSYVESNIELITDTIGYIIEHSIDDPDGMAKDSLDLIYNLRELRENFKRIKLSRNE